MVRHRGGSFRLPMDASIETAMRGVQEGWTTPPRRPAPGGMITLSRGEFGRLQVDADDWNRLPVDLRNALLVEIGDPGNRARGRQGHPD